MVSEWKNPTVDGNDTCNSFYKYIENYVFSLNLVNSFKVLILIFNLMNGFGSYQVNNFF